MKVGRVRARWGARSLLGQRVVSLGPSILVDVLQAALKLSSDDSLL